MPDQQPNAAKPIRLSRHACGNAGHRGTSEEEVVRCIREATWRPADGGRQECLMDFAFNKEWNEKHYTTKRVRPIFVEKDAEVVVVTVYVYYL